MSYLCPSEPNKPGKTMTITETKADVENVIREHMGHALSNLRVTAYGSMIDIDMTWTDGYSVPQLRRWAEERFPMLNNIHLERLYSDHSVAVALMELYEGDTDVCAKVEEILFTRTFEEMPS